MKHDPLNIPSSRSISSISLWSERWFFSTNAKDIGTLYLIFAVFSGLLGTAFSVIIRMELSGPGVQYIADNQLYNSIITAHAILMIFFMVKKSFNMLNMKPQLSLYTNMINEDKHLPGSADVKISKSNNYNDGASQDKNLNIIMLRF